MISRLGVHVYRVLYHMVSSTYRLYEGTLLHSVKTRYKLYEVNLSFVFCTSWLTAVYRDHHVVMAFNS